MPDAAMSGSARVSFPNGRWHGSWIWAAASAAATDGRHVVALRRTFSLDAVPASVPARMCALSNYALQVNGVDVARGPVRANPRRQPYDDIDLAPFLRGGDNVVSVIACRYDTATPWWMPPPVFANDLGGGAFVFEAQVGADQWWCTDDSWEAVVLDGWGSTPGRGVSGRGREMLDARSLPADWASGSSTPWPAALVRRAMTSGEPGRAQPPSFPGGPLGHRPTTWPTPEIIELTPLSCDEPATSTLAFTHDRIVVGVLCVDALVPEGESLVVTTAEFLDAHGRPAPSEHDASLGIVGDGTRRTLTSVDLFGLHGALVDLPDGAVIHSISIIERVHPVAGAHSFECSDPDLERIWQVGRRTVSICSLDAYIDCPTREQRAWAGDSVVHQMVDLATNDDWSLARWHPSLTASPRPDGMLPMAVAGDVEFYDFTIIPDWALHWVHSVWNLHRYVGDRAEIAGLLPVVEGVLRWFERFCATEGPLAGVPDEVFGWVIIDWSSVYTEGVSSALCGLWGRGLLEFAAMADWLGDGGRAEWARAAHAQLARGAELLWDPERERYVDSMVGGVRRPMASQHGQAAMIVGGLVPQDRLARLVQVITDEERLVHASFSSPDGPAIPNSNLTPGGAYLRTGHPAPWWDTEHDVVRAQPFFRYVVHDAVVAAGRADLVPTMCRDWLVALQRCATSWVETWHGGTISHGWSSTPTRDLVTHVLGVQPNEPGFGSARIDPELGSLEWARGTAPCGHGRGAIRVDVDRQRVLVDSPVPFVHAEVSYPAGRHEIARGSS